MIFQLGTHGVKPNYITIQERDREMPLYYKVDLDFSATL